MKISSLHEWLYSFRYIHWIIDAFFWHSDFHARSVIKIDRNGGLDCVEIVENHGLGGLGVAWSAFGMSLASFDHDFSANWRLDGRRMG